ncbi:MAG: protein kinase domain-containing protein [Limisphaerales bacterium]
MSASIPQATPSVPDHELFHRIGAGAYGEVWLARNLATGALRAVKIVHRSTFADERPFNREFEGIKKFDAVSRSHPGQLALFHVGRNDAAGYFYYVMELADSIRVAADVRRLTTPERTSATVKQAIESEPPHVGCYTAHTLRADLEHGRLAAARVLEIALALSEALAHLHTNGLVHRDVKPSNIIFVGGRPKLADIGLVTDASDSRSIVGTEGYLPREGPGTPAADIFALGKVLYEALTGLDRRQYPELPADLRQWPDSALAFELNTILVKACAADPNQRYTSAEAMLADLKLLEAGKSVKRRRSIQRGWARSWKAAVAVALVALGFLLINNERARRAAIARLNASPFENSGTTNYAAWEAVQRAIQMTHTYTASGMSNSVQELERAIALDPNYASAWGNLSSRLHLLAAAGFTPSKEAMQRAQVCAETALRLRPADGGAHFLLGECVLALTYDLARAESLFREGIALDPKFPNLRNNLVAEIWCYGRFAEAEALLNQVEREEPSSESVYNLRARIYAATGRFDEALTAAGESVRLQPGRPSTYSVRSEILWAMSRRADAARDLLRFVELNGFVGLDPMTDVPSLRLALTELKPEGFLSELIQRLEKAREHGLFVSAFDLARLHAQAGDKARALDYLEQAVDEHRSMTLTAKYTPAFKDFQNEPRYHAVLRRLKLEK